MTLFVSEDEAARRVGSDNNLSKIEHRKMTNVGRKKGVAMLSPQMRALIGLSARIDGTSNAAKAFGVSDRTVRTLKKGKASPFLARDAEQSEAIEKGIAEKVPAIQNAALTKLMIALDLVDKDSLGKKGARDLTGAAKDLATIHEKLQPKQLLSNNEGPTVVIYTPTVAKESDYHVIEVEHKVVK